MKRTIHFNLFALRTAPGHYLMHAHATAELCEARKSPVNTDLRYLSTAAIEIDDPGEDPELSREILKGAYKPKRPT